MMKMTPGRWLFGTSLIYFVVGMVVNTFVYEFTTVEVIQLVWLIVMSSPLYTPPLSRWTGIKLIWKL